MGISAGAGKDQFSDTAGCLAVEFLDFVQIGEQVVDFGLCGRAVEQNAAGCQTSQDVFVVRIDRQRLFQNLERFEDVIVLELDVGQRDQRQWQPRIDFDRTSGMLRGVGQRMVLQGGEGQGGVHFSRLRIDRQGLFQLRNRLPPVVFFQKQHAPDKMRLPAVLVFGQSIIAQRIDDEIEDLRDAVPAGIL